MKSQCHRRTHEALFFSSAVSNKLLTSFKESHEDWKNYSSKSSLELGKKASLEALLIPSSFMHIIVTVIQVQ